MNYKRPNGKLQKARQQTTTAQMVNYKRPDGKLQGARWQTARRLDDELQEAR